MTILADSVEDRDAWRTLWRALTSDVLLIALCAIIIAGLIAMAALPQQPAAGTSDPVAYSRWEAEAKRREAALYEPLNSLGLNNVAQLAWWRIALAVVIPIAGLRLADRLVRLVEVWRGRCDERLQGERRVHVLLNAPPLDELAARLRSWHYRIVRPTRDLLVADRAPWAELASVALHVGLSLAATGLLINLTIGWEASNRAVVAGVMTPLRDGYAMTLADSTDEHARVAAMLQPGDVPVALEGGRDAHVAGVSIALRQIMPGYRLSATTQDGKPLLIRASNFVSPTTEMLITFSMDEPERYLAVPEARVALALTAATSSDQPVRLQAFAIPSGIVISDTIVQQELIINGATFRFKPALGAVIDAHYAPGDGLRWLGLALMALGAVGGLIYPMRRILIRRRGEWTEFYAGGRNSRQEVSRLTEPDPGANLS